MIIDYVFFEKGSSIGLDSLREVFMIASNFDTLQDALCTIDKPYNLIWGIDDVCFDTLQVVDCVCCNEDMPKLVFKEDAIFNLKFMGRLLLVLKYVPDGTDIVMNRGGVCVE